MNFQTKLSFQHTNMTFIWGSSAAQLPAPGVHFWSPFSIFMIFSHTRANPHKGFHRICQLFTPSRSLDASAIVRSYPTLIPLHPHKELRPGYECHVTTITTSGSLGPSVWSESCASFNKCFIRAESSIGRTEPHPSPSTVNCMYMMQQNCVEQGVSLCIVLILEQHLSI